MKTFFEFLKNRLKRVLGDASGKEFGRLWSFIGQVDVMIRGFQSFSLDQGMYECVLSLILRKQLMEEIKLPGYCESSPPSLSQLNCRPDEQRTPLRDKDYSGNDPQWVPGFLSRSSGMFP